MGLVVHILTDLLKLGKCQLKFCFYCFFLLHIEKMFWGKTEESVRAGSRWESNPAQVEPKCLWCTPGNHYILGVRKPQHGVPSWWREFSSQHLKPRVLKARTEWLPGCVTEAFQSVTTNDRGLWGLVVVVAQWQSTMHNASVLGLVLSDCPAFMFSFTLSQFKVMHLFSSSDYCILSSKYSHKT